jgi:hypothetical protein
MELVKYENKQGLHMKEKEKENRASVLMWIMNNPNGKMKDCEEWTGLSHVTVRKHMRELGVK